MDTHDSAIDQQEPGTGGASAKETASKSVLFLTTDLQQRIDLIRHLVANSERIPLLKGVHGVGKSTLMRVLIQQAPTNWELLTIQATPMLQPDQLSYQLCHHFAPQKGGSESPEQLVERFADLRAQGKLPVILVDDADQLSVSTLTELFGIYSRAFGQEGGMALVLFASPLIDDLLQKIRQQFASQRLQLLELFPMHREQSDQFVRYLFNLLAGQQELTTSEEEFERIYRASSGLPAKIIQQVEQMLQPETITPSVLVKRRIFLPQLLSDVSAPVLVGGVILALLLLLTLIFEDEINAVFEPESIALETTGIATVQMENVIPLRLPDQPIKVDREEIIEHPEDLPDDSQNDKKALIETAIETATPITAATDEESPSPTEVKISLPQLAERQPPDVRGEMESTEQPKEPEISAPGNQDSETRTPAEITVPTENLPPPSIEKKKPETAPAAEKASIQPPQPETVETAVDHEQSVPAPVIELGRTKAPEKSRFPAPVTITKKPEQASPAAIRESGIRRENWLLKQPPQSYTLQLIGLGDERSVNEFIRRYKLEGRTAYFQTESNGRPWFPVLYGIYPNRDAAVAARSNLPPEITRKGIWPRSLASIHQAIKGK